VNFAEELRRQPSGIPCRRKHWNPRKRQPHHRRPPQIFSLFCRHTPLW